MPENILKYGRTFHLPYSPGTTSDDKKLESDSHLIGKEVVVTLKCDGENFNFTSEKCWARSVDSRDHVSRNWSQQYWNSLKYDIPNDMRICCENVYATHNIHYTKLPTYVLCFNIWRYDYCLPWDETLEWAELLGLTMVPTLYRGIYSKEKILECATGGEIFGGVREGIVGRFPNGFLRSEMKDNMFKWVREGHVKKEDKHWFSKKVVPNELEIQS